MPKKFLEQILLSLKVWDLYPARRAKTLGCDSSPTGITIATVIRMIDGPLAPLHAPAKPRFRKCDECADIKTSRTRLS